MSDTTGMTTTGGGGSTMTADLPAGTASDAASKAKDVGAAGIDQAKAVASDAKEQATELASQASDQAKRVVSLTRDELRSLADERTQQLSEGLRRLSQQLGSISTGEQGGVVEDIGRDIGHRVSSLADRLDRDGLDGAIRQVTTMAQRRPGAFLVGAAAAGFLAARVVRDTNDVVSNQSDGTADGSTVGPAAAGPSNVPITAPATAPLPAAAAPAGTAGVVESIGTIG